MASLHTRMVNLVTAQQERIVDALEQIEDKQFRVDKWTRPDDGGYGISCVLENGTVFERGGVNISVVHGQMTGAAAMNMRENHTSIQRRTEALDYSAVGLSLILHPQNAMAPTVHMNCRFLMTDGGNRNGEERTCWFGGGTDLTPCYLFEEDARHFHEVLKTVCDKHDSSYYPSYKAWCDKYFWNAHRSEARGIGGIFFDNLGEGLGSTELDNIFLFVQDFLHQFLPAYIPILEKRRNMEYTQPQKEWQQLRRGRYVEFNLLHDRGTKFGLSGTMPRVESILMSLPLTASWRYDFEPEKGSREQDLIDVLRTPKQWM